MLIVLISLVVIFVVVAFFFMRFAPQFGQGPDEARLVEIQTSPNYKEGEFKNMQETVMEMSFRQMPKILYEWLFNTDGRVPKSPLPTQFSNDEPGTDTLLYVTWYGHSAILLEMEGKKILLDPMLGSAASPVSFMTRRFKYQNPIKLEDIPEVDAVIYSHDHYDHLDYHSVLALKNKVNHFYAPLAVGEHLKRWGVEESKITELDWWQSANLDHITLTATPSRHFSGRKFSDRNKSLWASWVIKGDRYNIYFSGDSGYGEHFKLIGEKYGPFDFTMMECGQYNERWKPIHMMPEETVQAHLDVEGSVMMPIHWGAFNLALHDWTDPVVRAKAEAERLGATMINPVIGRRFALPEVRPQTSWWEEVQ